MEMKKSDSHAECVTALAHRPISKAEEVWPIIVENVQQKEKLSLFLDYFFEQWMENQKVEY